MHIYLPIRNNLNTTNRPSSISAVLLRHGNHDL
jgi:hypothetical protein